MSGCEVLECPQEVGDGTAPGSQDRGNQKCGEALRGWESTAITLLRRRRAGFVSSGPKSPTYKLTGPAETSVGPTCLFGQPGNSSH